MKRILITGMYRSGSTWQFNAVRLLLEELTLESINACFISDYKPDPLTSVELIKLHKFDQELAESADLVIHSIRDIDEVRKSMERVGMVITEDRMIEHLEDSEKWEKIANHCSYEIASNKIARIHCFETIEYLINKHIVPITYDGAELKRIFDMVEAIKAPESGNWDNYDKVTLLHPNHISVV